ncbi:hypothetical protein BH23BAC1_BH23BAC1_17890 [soil metagenome]
MPPQHQKPRLYALLVAINAYNSPVPPLKGCVNDLEKIAVYLQKEIDYFEVEVIKLIDKEATKDAVARQFREHLGRASDMDVAFFYFSGHGTQEEADPVFRVIEEDRKLEALVCYDSYSIHEGQPSFNLLADKELRYLIHAIAGNGAHIVTLFDCCHSGGNTRNGYISMEADAIREKRFIYRARLSQAFPAREWRKFIFSDTISYEDAQKQTVQKLLPEGKHIQIAACQNDQSAFEVNGEGVFTKNLLEVLMRCEGAITYYDLQSRVQHYIKNQFDQNPKIYSVGEDESILFHGFLNKKVGNKPLYGNINYNDKLGWIMDLGTMHGISGQSLNLNVLTLDDKRQYAAKIGEVFPTYCQIVFQDDYIDTNLSLKGYLTDYFSHPIGIFPNIHDEEMKGKLFQLIAGVNPNLHFTEKIYEADYCIEFVEGRLFISRPGMQGIPIIKPVQYKSDNDLNVIKNYLDHLSQYEFVKNLHNPNAFLLSNIPVEITVLRKDNLQEMPTMIKQDELLLEIDRPVQRQWGGSIRISLKNVSDRKLYCALFYLSFNFGVSVKLLKEVVVGLEPNREVWALDGAPIGLILEEEVIRYNYQESTSFLKLIVSTTDFRQQASRFEMPSLPGPLDLGVRGFDLGVDAYNPGNIEDWSTRLVTVKIKNPDYNPV